MSKRGVRGKKGHGDARRGEDSPEELVALDAELRLRGLHRLLLVAGVVRHRAGLLSRTGGQLPRFPGVRSFVRVCLRSSTREGWLRVSPSQGPESGAASLEQSPSLGANRVRNLVLVCVCSEPSDGRLLRSVSPFTSTSSSPCLDQYSLLDSTPTRGEFNGIAQNFVEFAFFPDFISGRTSAWKRSKLNDG